jgi:acetyl-CoA acetyltransferase
MRVAIVGIGMHPFGRTPGRSGMQQGAHAARLALVDAGVQWKHLQFGYGGSYSSGNADAVANELGLTGVPFTNILNRCATGGSSLLAACGARQVPGNPRTGYTHVYGAAGISAVTILQR